MKSSQEIKLALSDRFRGFRDRAKLSQDELGKRLGVSGNYISMIELGKKYPGPSLLKFFDLLEHSPIYHAATPVSGMESPYSSSAGWLRDDTLCSMLSTETLVRSFAEMAEKLARSDSPKQKRMIGSLRELLDEIEQRLLVDSGAPSEAPRSASPAVKPGGNPETK